MDNKRQQVAVLNIGGSTYNFLDFRFNSCYEFVKFNKAIIEKKYQQNFYFNSIDINRIKKKDGNIVEKLNVLFLSNSTIFYGDQIEFIIKYCQENKVKLHVNNHKDEQEEALK